MTMPGGDLNTVVQRIADDEAFAELVRANPTKALYGYLLTNWDRDRITKIANGIDPDAPELDEHGQPVVLVPIKPAPRKRVPRATAPVAPPPVDGPSEAAPTTAAPTQPPRATPRTVTRPVPTAATAKPAPAVAPAPARPRPNPPPATVIAAPEPQEEPKRGVPVLWLVSGAALVLLLVGLVLGGVFSGGKDKTSASLIADPTPFVTDSPSPTPSPSDSPTDLPTYSPTDTPVVVPTTTAPTTSPTPSPIASPTPPPTPSPTRSPTPSPTPSPTKSPKPLPAPAVGNPNANPGYIYEKQSPCSGFTSTISASATDSAGITSVVLSWSVNGRSGTRTMSPKGSTYSGTVGPFDPSTISGGPQPIDVSITATDSGGRQSSTTTQVTLNDSSTC